MISGRIATTSLVLTLALLGGCRDNTARPTPAAPIPPNASADPAWDLGAGTPGAYCATNRLGKRFVKDGVTYVCKGPKPYRWREVRG